MYINFRDFFPYDIHPDMRAGQGHALDEMKKVPSGLHIVLQAPTGFGKLAVCLAFLEAHRDKGDGQLLLLQPNKALFEQVQQSYPHVKVACGRNEHPCLYPRYEGKNLKADEIPCSILADCPHRVDQTTGETHTKGAAPCPYLQQKFDAKMATGPVLCTNAFFLFTVLFSKEFNPTAVAIDEADRFAESIRAVLHTDLTDWMLTRSIEALNELGSRQVRPLSNFLQKMKGLVKSRALGHETLLEDDEIEHLYNALNSVNPNILEQEMRASVRDGVFDVEEDRLILKQLEDICRIVRRFKHALKFAMETPKHKPLNFVIAYGKKELGERERVQYKITVKDYYVRPLIQKMLPAETLATSATIGDPEIFFFETGIKGKFIDIASEFPATNARIYAPDPPEKVEMRDRKVFNLAKKIGRKQDKTKTLRTIASTAKRFARKGIRSLVLVVSNEERQKFLMLAGEEGLNTLSYDKETPPRECSQRFRDGEGECLVGTINIYGVGLDLPKQCAPVTWVLRPGYPPPDDPETLFEERRFGKNRKWALVNYRIMVALLQSRGRNIRSVDDKGVTFFMDQRFRKFAYGSLPTYLRSAYRGQWDFEKCVEDAMKLLT